MPSHVCARTIAPLLDMQSLYAWRLLLDRILSRTGSVRIKICKLYLARGNVFTQARTWESSSSPS
jgi:hypothetical protein